MSLIALIPIIGEILDKIIPDADERAKAKAELKKLEEQGELARLDVEARIAESQNEVNKIEAAGNWVRANWRPAAGWVCVIGLFYQMLIRPFLILALILSGHTLEWEILNLDMETLGTLLFGMLGLGYYRHKEKLNGVY